MWAVLQLVNGAMALLVDTEQLRCPPFTPHGHARLCYAHVALGVGYH